MGTPTFAANASAAFVGCPSLNAAVSGGPMTSSSRSNCWLATSCTSTASRRGVPSARTSRCDSRTFASSSATILGRALSAASTNDEGSSSVPISRSKGRAEAMRRQEVVRKGEEVEVGQSNGARRPRSEATSSASSAGRSSSVAPGSTSGSQGAPSLANSCSCSANDPPIRAHASERMARGPSNQSHMPSMQAREAPAQGRDRKAFGVPCSGSLLAKYGRWFAVHVGRHAMHSVARIVHKPLRASCADRSSRVQSELATHALARAYRPSRGAM